MAPPQLRGRLAALRRWRLRRDSARPAEGVDGRASEFHFRLGDVEILLCHNHRHRRG